MAHIVIERSGKQPITDVSLLRHRKILKRAYKECGDPGPPSFSSFPLAESFSHPSSPAFARPDSLSDGPAQRPNHPFLSPSRSLPLSLTTMWAPPVRFLFHLPPERRRAAPARLPPLPRLHSRLLASPNTHCLPLKPNRSHSTSTSSLNGRRLQSPTHRPLMASEAPIRRSPLPSPHPIKPPSTPRSVPHLHIELLLANTPKTAAADVHLIHRRSDLSATSSTFFSLSLLHSRTRAASPDLPPHRLNLPTEPTIMFTMVSAPSRAKPHSNPARSGELSVRRRHHQPPLATSAAPSNRSHRIKIRRPTIVSNPVNREPYRQASVAMEVPPTPAVPVARHPGALPVRSAAGTRPPWRTAWSVAGARPPSAQPGACPAHGGERPGARARGWRGERLVADAHEAGEASGSLEDCQFEEEPVQFEEEPVQFEEPDFLAEQGKWKFSLFIFF
ncbi:hypothetical protein HU200_027961 [Digitaria exilis]|uniref:Uncharacterized protein n=1 Tax=Digitaria exilis TaxID=1010633 RepID=A0A835C4B4_9POAL|nr:hypothetical protein HU200_027961 [Digitaria exilis]